MTGAAKVCAVVTGSPELELGSAANTACVVASTNTAVMAVLYCTALLIENAFITRGFPQFRLMSGCSESPRMECRAPVPSSLYSQDVWLVRRRHRYANLS